MFTPNKSRPNRYTTQTPCYGARVTVDLNVELVKGPLEHKVDNCSIRKSIGIYSIIESDHGDAIIIKVK
jgi:hypothetical protein